MAKVREESVFVYVVARDFGFAPNPFFGYCTLACCKPKIRSKAVNGDWVFGIAGSKLEKPGHCVFGMRVTDGLSFDEYWMDERFTAKKPVRNGSRAMMLGDNIYHRESELDAWQQEDSHHSRPDGLPDQSNVERDTGTNRVLISEDFTYFGRSAPEVPRSVFDAMGYENRIGHRNFKRTEAQPLLDWFWVESQKSDGPIVDDPFQFRQSAARFSSGTNKIIEEVLEPMVL
tara:strand:+ start:2351 stop:3040 length:690 start_codon:yes stop_codon:yes gene_type:complete